MKLSEPVAALNCFDVQPGCSKSLFEIPIDRTVVTLLFSQALEEYVKAENSTDPKAGFKSTLRRIPIVYIVLTVDTVCVPASRQLPQKPTNGAHHGGDAAMEMRQRGTNGTAGAKEEDPLLRPEMLYEVDDTPPWYYCIVLGFQVWTLCRKGLS